MSEGVVVVLLEVDVLIAGWVGIQLLLLFSWRTRPSPAAAAPLNVE